MDDEPAILLRVVMSNANADRGDRCLHGPPGPRTCAGEVGKSKRAKSRPELGRRAHQRRLRPRPRRKTGCLDSTEIG